MADATTWVAIGSLGTCASALFVARQTAVASRALRESAVQQRQILELGLRATAAKVWLSAEISHFGLWNEGDDPNEIIPIRGDVDEELLIRAYVRCNRRESFEGASEVNTSWAIAILYVEPHQNWTHSDNDALFSNSLDDSPKKWFGNYMASGQRHYLQLNPGHHVFIHYRTYLTFDAW